MSVRMTRTVTLKSYHKFWFTWSSLLFHPNMHANAYKTKPGRITLLRPPPFQKARHIFVDILFQNIWLICGLINEVLPL